MCGSAGNMAPIFILSAQRLWLPSRTVVSMKLISLLIWASRKKVPIVQDVQGVQIVGATDFGAYYLYKFS
jgi:hypothetical protein